MEKHDLDFRGDWILWGRVVLLIPFLVLSGACLVFSLFPLFLFLWSLFPGHWLIPVGAYYAIGLLFFIPAVENVMWTYLDRSSHTPAYEENQRLDPAWRDVIARVGKGADRKYNLRVVASPHLNAYAAGGRQVAVTRGALQYLDDSELRGVVAHELGHHAGLDPVVGLAYYWMRKPIGWAHWVSVMLQNLAIAMTRIAFNSCVYRVDHRGVVVASCGVCLAYDREPY